MLLHGRDREPIRDWAKMIPGADYSMLQQRVKAYTASTDAERQVGDEAVSPALKLTRNGTTIQELSLDMAHVLIGRAEDNDLSIPTRYVSQHHILLVRRGGSMILIDLHSTNGTYVNGERVYKHVLVHNDVITVDCRSMFVSYEIEYSEPSAVIDTESNDELPMDPEIEKVAASIESLLSGGDTDVLPKLSGDMPTVVGVIDDR